MEIGFLKFILASLPATVVMTGFSYFVSKLFRQTFKEPILLGYIVMKGKSANAVSGWILHFVTGMVFACSYNVIHLLGWLPFNLTGYYLLSLLSGIGGIVTWAIAFTMTDKPVKINKTAYFIQLFIAHVIFTMVVFFVVSLQNGK